MDKKYIYWGGGAIAVIGFVLYRKKASSAAASQQSQSAGYIDSSMTSPALMYMPSGVSGNSGGVSPSITSAATELASAAATPVTAPTSTVANTGASTSSLSSAIQQIMASQTTQAQIQAGAATNISDNNVLSSLDLSGVKTASVSHTSDGSTITLGAPAMSNAYRSLVTEQGMSDAQYYETIRNYANTHTSAEVAEQATKWGVSQNDITTAMKTSIK